MPHRQRHDEFIWALIFSLIVNLLFVFALLAQRYVEKSPGLHPFVVSIATSNQALPSQTHAIPGPAAIPVPVKIQKRIKLPPTLHVPSANVDPPLSTPDSTGEATSSPVAAAKTAGAATDLSSGVAAGESVPATIGKKSESDPSIWGDKMAGDHYTAPQYLGGEKPPYPKRAERNGWEGTVLLNLLINANGEVEKVGIAKTSGYDLLDQQALASVGAWRFKPARRNGLAIAVAVQQPIIFRPSLPKNDP